MRATSRVGLLLVLAACGGGERAGRSDTTAMSSPGPPSDTTAAAMDTMRHDSATAAPAAPAPAAQDSMKKSATTAAQDTTKKAAGAPAQDTTKKTAKKAAAGAAQSPQQVALGDSIFHGQVGGGTCTACHGQDAKGTAVAPDLTDSQWINGDGSYQFIVNTVTTGVPKPKQHPAPMPPKGGAALTDDQVKAVAAYVYSLSHKS